MEHATRLWDRISPRLLPFLAVLVALSLVGPAAAQSIRNDDLRVQAQACEKRGDWLEACRVYDEMIRADRGNVEAREAYHRCYRQYQIVQRHSDRVYRDMLTRLEPAQALDIYEAVLNTVSQKYVDQSKVEINALFKHGVRELRYALNQDVFVREHLAGAKPAALEAFKNRLADWPESKLANRSDVRNQILSLAGIAQQEGLVASKGPFAVVLALEFAFGACTGLDEYTLFLTPRDHNDMLTAVRGKYVGIGIDLAVLDGELIVTRVYPRSPAAEAKPPLEKGSRIIRIDQQTVKSLPPEKAADLLRGEVDSLVEMEVLMPGAMVPTPYSLTRKLVAVPSVDFEGPDEEYIGRLRITHFQETTVQEVKEALAQLQTRGMKGLILDLRGNPGGAFLPAVKVAELFLPDGVIVNTTSYADEFKDKVFRVKNHLNPLMTPMCVLIDAETASSAELLAGALKENGRARLFGQTSFGKGSIQSIFPLEKSPGGVRITVAKFTSPRKNQYTNTGVTPHLVINGDGQAVLDAALNELRLMLRCEMPMRM